MTEPPTRTRRWWKYLLIASGFLILLCLNLVHHHGFVPEIRPQPHGTRDRADTGGRAEVGTFHLVPFHLQVEVRNITVHGKEAANEVPLAHADSLLAQVKVISLLRTEFGFRTVVLDRPVVHIAIGTDGVTTNIPGFKITPAPVSNRVEQLFGLSIDHLSVRNGELLWADQKIPLDFNVSGTNLEMDYSFLRGRYESHLSIGKVDTAFDGYRPFSWMTSVDFALGTTFADIQSLSWNSGRSSVKASGRISDFRNLQIVGNYDAQLDLEEAAAIARRQDLRHGVAQLKGSGRWSLEEFTANGALSMRDLIWQDEQFVLRSAGATADYSLTDKQLSLSKLQGKTSVAALRARRRWRTGCTAHLCLQRGKTAAVTLPSFRRRELLLNLGEKAKASGVQSGTMHLRVRDASVAELATTLDVRAHPVGRFRPTGLAVGNIDRLTGRESRQRGHRIFVQCDSTCACRGA